MKILFLAACAMISFCAYAQKESPYVKFGKISVADLQRKVYPIDTSANAVVLSDIGSGVIEGNFKGWFSIIMRRHKVVHILNKNGYGQADVEIPLYIDGEDEERLDNIRAVTYNLEGGKITETKLDKSSVFKEKVDKNRILRKFTMPNVKEGCIIEFEYQVSSDFISNLDPWYFQSRTAPQLWSEYSFSVPQFFTYNFLSRGYHEMFINDRKDRMGNFSVRSRGGTGSSQPYNFSSGITEYRWAMKDIPELKEESFTSSIRNHISRIEFQLAAHNHPLNPRNFRTTWEELVQGLLESEHFGKQLNGGNNWLSDDVKPLFASASDNLQKARSIYEFVRSNFSCTGNSGHIYMGQTLKNVLKTKKGSVADINLLLATMLRYAGIDATPVILSTTNHGYALEYSPMTSNFNYVVVHFSDKNKSYFLDASKPDLGFARLLPYCYNGHARMVNQMADPVHLSADSLKESKTTLMIIANDREGKWVGSMNQMPGYYESFSIRESVKEKGAEEFFKQVEKDFGWAVRIRNPAIDSLKNYDKPVALKYNIDLDLSDDEIMYVNPVFGEGYTKNPFSAADRYYPVEMPYSMDETIVLTMEVPKGYVVDELPKQLLAKYDEEGNSFFEYRITQSENTISFRTRIKIDRAFFLPEEYEGLREFFNLVVRKHKEQIVFKKKK